MRKQASMHGFARPAFLITIDTEGDNLWARPKEITTANTRFLPRFQTLCDAFGLKPTYLVNYEMACDPAFVTFAKAAAADGRAEVGAHLHAWNSPPVVPLTDDDNRFHPYLTEFPAEVMSAKLTYMTRLLEARFERKMTSHRGGRWAFDETYAKLLVELGYGADCSVTPHISWSRHGNAPAGLKGPDFRGFPERPYWLDTDDIRSSGGSGLLEIPMTIRPAGSRSWTRIGRRIPAMSGYLQRRWPEQRWLRPNGVNTNDLIDLCEEVVAADEPCAMFMLHSSEFMPGGSPAFSTVASIERLYGQLHTLFTHAAQAFTAMTLSGFREQYAAHHRNGI